MRKKVIKVVESAEEMEEVIKKMLPDLKKEFSFSESFVVMLIVLTDIVRYFLFENKAEIRVDNNCRKSTWLCS